MPDYGHDLTFGTFLTPQNQRPEDVVALAQLTEARRARPRDVPGSPVPARVPRHLDAADVGRRADRDAAGRGERAQPAAAPAGRARALRGQPRPAVRRALRARARRRRVLGRDRGDGRPAPHAGRGGRRAQRGDRRHPRHLGHRPSAAACASRGEHYAVKGAKRGPEPAHDIEIWLGALQAADAAADRPQGRRLAAVAGLPAARGPRARPTRRSTRRRVAAGPRPARDPAAAEHRPPEPTRRSSSCCRSSSSTASARSSSPATTRARSSASGRRSRPRCARRSPRERAAAGTGRPGAPRGARALAARRDGHRLRRAARVAGRDAPSSPATGRTPRSARPTCAPGSPGLVLRPRTPDEVAEALAFARAQDVPLAVRSGGHGISGRSTNDGGDRHRPRRARTGRGARPGDRPRARSAPARAGARSRRRSRRTGSAISSGRLRRRRRRRPGHHRRHRLPRPQARAHHRPRHRAPSSCSPTARVVRADARPAPRPVLGAARRRRQLRDRHRVRARRLPGRRRRLQPHGLRGRRRAARALGARSSRRAPRELTSFLTMVAGAATARSPSSTRSTRATTSTPPSTR